MPRLLLLITLLFLPGVALAQAEPTTVEALVKRGNTRFDANNLGGARTDAESALQLSPDDFAAMVLMGRVLGRSERWSEAQSYFDRALEQRPEDPVALRGKALTLCGLGQRDEARKVLDDAIALHPDDALLHYNRAYVIYHDREALSPEDTEAALSDLKRAQQLDPNDPDAWGVSGWIKWLYLNKPALALRDVSRAIELGHMAEDYRTRALIFRDMGELERAEADVRQGLRVVGDKSELRNSLQELLTEIEGLRR